MEQKKNFGEGETREAESHNVTSVSQLKKKVCMHDKFTRYNQQQVLQAPKFIVDLADTLVVWVRPLKLRAGSPASSPGKSDVAEIPRKNRDLVKEL